jgi:hypothetical protein
MMKARYAAEKRKAAKIAARKAAAKIAAEKAERARQLKRKRQEYKAAAPKTTLNYGSPKQYALSRLGSAQFSCLNNIVNHESGWNYRASNPSSVHEWSLRQSLWRMVLLAKELLVLS